MPGEVGETDEATTESAAVDVATREPATGTGTGASTTKAKKGRVEQIRKLLASTSTGQWALAILKKHKVKVHWSYAGTGSYHSGGEIFLNKNQSGTAAASTMIHEAQHAYTHKSGNAANIRKLSRKEYVKTKIADEAAAVLRQIHGAVEMHYKGGHSLKGLTIDMGKVERYRKAFYKHRDMLRAKHPKMSTAEINRRCEKHVRDTEITSWFHDGTFITSTDKNTYADFYGKQWDDEHKKPGDGK